jgi:6-phosphogluconolactonase
MTIEILDDATAVATRAARWIADAARDAVAARGQAVLAVSGGHTPWQMLRLLAAQPMPWAKVHLFQIDERIAPAGSPDRNLTHIKECLGPILDTKDGLPASNLHAMPVEASDPSAAAVNYARELEAVAGSPPVLDVAHLGLGPDGHTASLVPHDAVLEVVDRDVAVTGVYSGHVRMTLTFPVLDRAREVLWVVTGAEKAPVLPRLVASDRSIPAGRVRSDRAALVADREAAAGLPLLK